MRLRSSGLWVPDDLPEHPVTGLRALGRRRDGSPIWPVGGMADQYWVTPIAPFHTAAGAAFATFTAFQDISPVPVPLLFGGQLRVGSKIEIEAWGEFSTTGTPTLSIGFFYGTAAVVLAASNLAATTTTGAAWQWHLKYCGTVLTVGATGTILGQGIEDRATSLTAMGTSPIPVTAAARTVTIDTTTNKALGVGAQWGTSNAANSIKCNDLRAMLLN